MARLPIPGSDDGSWGAILNDFLSQSHSNDGTLRPTSVATPALADNAVTEAKLSTSVQTKLNTQLGTDVVHKTGNETIAGNKDFTGTVTVGSVEVALKDDQRLTDQRVPIDNSVSTQKLQNSSVSNAKIASVDASKLSSGILDEARLPDLSATYAQIVVWAGSSYPVRPSNNNVALFIGPSDPGGVMHVGDVWVQTS